MKIIRNYGSRDPMWYGAGDQLPPPTEWFSEALCNATAPTSRSMIPVIEEQQHNSHVIDYWTWRLPVIEEQQHNSHVIDYWTWRLGKLADGVNVRVRRI
jgi:hypothetical protein